MKTCIKIRIVPTHLGCWTVWINGWRVIKSTREPLVEIAERLLAGGLKHTSRIWLIRTPIGYCRCVSTLGAAATADATGHPFRAPDWAPAHSNGAS